MKKNVFMCLAVTALWASCSQQEQYPESNGVPMELSGVIGGTRVPIESNESDLPTSAITSLSIFRTDGHFSGGEIAYAPFTATTSNFSGTFNADGTITMNPTQYYLDNEYKSRFIALDPAPTESFTYTIDGDTDIIASQVVEGNKTSIITTPMAFEHLLTQVKVFVKAETDAAVTKWGAIKTISIKSTPLTATVTLPNPPAALSIATITGIEASRADLLIVHTGDNMSIPITTAGSYGYAMFLPTTGPLTLTIETENYTIEKTTTATTFVAGKVYPIELKFTATALSVSVSPNNATLDAWDTTAQEDIEVTEPPAGA
jgi:predicted secreted hydrolase